MLSDIKFYLAVFLRRIHYFLFVFLLVSAAALSVAYTLPPVYSARARLLVESPQIPIDLATSTVRADSGELLQIIRQRMLTRASLLELSRKFSVHASIPNLEPDKIVDDMDRRIKLQLPGARDIASIVTVSFEAPTAAMSAQVTNELVTRILQENVALRTAVTGQTLEFFRQEVARLDDELAQQGAKILEFQLANKDALPDSLNYRRSRQASLQERLVLMERDLAGLRDRRDRMTMLFERNGDANIPGERLSPDQQRLKELETQLTQALAIYSETNPRVKALKAQIDAARANIVGQVEADTNTSEVPQTTLYEIQLADIDGQLDFISKQKQQLEAEVETLQTSIDATPKNAVTLGALERDYENIRVQYNQATADLAAARTGDQIEAQSRGQRISVLEQAIEPRAPSSPNRPKIMMKGVAAGTALGLGFVALLELLNSSIRRPVDLSRGLGITPFATVPYIRTRRQVVTRRLIIWSALLFVGVGIPLALYLLHVYYLPMDLLIEKVANKLGIADFLSKFQ